MEAYRTSGPCRALVPLLVGAAICAGGCSGSGSGRSTAEALPAPGTARPIEAGDPAAFVDGRAVTWRELIPVLAESAGGAALEEVALDLLIDRELAGAGLTVGAEEIARERATLLESVARGARTDENDAARLLEEVRRSRGLGEARFNASLARTAKLRRLVAGTVTVTEEEVRQAHAIRYGPTVRVRVILVPTEREAATVLAELRPEEEGLTARFARVAVDRSRDSTAPRGGEIGSLSLADPTYPAALRESLGRLEPGRLTPVIAVDRGFAIALLEGRNEGDGATLENTRDALHEELVRRRERIAMDDLARRLLRSAMISVQDRGLAESWERRQGP